MSDIVLLSPGGSHGIFGSDLARSLISIEQPLWCRLCAGYLLDRGVDVTIVDQEALRLTPEAAAVLVAAERPRVAAIVVWGHQPSASTQAMPGARALAEAIRCAAPSVTIVMLGNHPSALPERTLREEPVDYVIDGEGPASLHALLEGGGPSSVPGLVWRHHDRVIHNPLAPLLDLDRDLHGRAWHLLPSPSRYRAHTWQCLDDQSRRRPYAAVYTSLNCPFACHFCMISTIFHDHKYRHRSPEAVVDEIEMLYREYGVATLKIVDELFVLNRGHYRAVCQGLVDRGLGERLNIWAYARPDCVPPCDLPLLRAAGIRWLALGIESGSYDVRVGAGKGLRGDRGGDDTIHGTVEAIRAAGISVIGNYIFGLRDDTRETMRATLDLAKSLGTEFANFYCAMAYPGSALYAEAVAEGWTLPESWAGYSQHNRYCRPLDTRHVSAAEVLRFRDAAFDEYFSDPDYLAMIAGKFGAAAVDHVRAMTAYRLPRDLLAAA
jgi:anaerobic magnesium-protoporphyrin IX monomethyl ester cyclase